MQHRVLVLGNTGMLGHMVEHVLAADERLIVRGVSRAECDAGGDLRTLTELLSRAEHVVNCVGVIARHIDDTDPTSVARAIRVNAEFPHALAAAAGARGVRVIHVSTDGVFTGRATEPYAEDAVPDAPDTYGRTKILGESRALNVLNVRTSIIGPSPVKHEGLWEWVASQPDGATVDGYTNHIWHGVTTLQFAELCRRIIAEGRFNALRTAGDVLHFVPNAPITKAELVEHIAAALRKRMTVRPIAHEQSVHRMLAMCPDVSAMFGEGQPIAKALRICAAVHA